MSTQLSNILQIIAIIASTLTSIISIFIAVKSLKLTHKSIIDSNRPYIVVYSDFIQISKEKINYLIIKNFGKSSAIIDTLSFSTELFYEDIYKPFVNFSNCSIAPNQFYSTKVKYKCNPYKPFDVTIEYHDNISKYKDTFKINPQAIEQQIININSNNTQTQLEKTISITAQEIMRRNL